MEATQSTESVAERFYRKHVDRVLAYQRANPGKVNEKNKRHYNKMKEENADKYKQYLEYHRIYNRKLRENKKRGQEEEKSMEVTPTHPISAIL